MEIQKAIELLNDFSCHGVPPVGADFKEAVKMATRALVQLELRHIKPLEDSDLASGYREERRRYVHNPRD